MGDNTEFHVIVADRSGRFGSDWPAFASTYVFAGRLAFSGIRMGIDHFACQLEYTIALISCCLVRMSLVHVSHWIGSFCSS